MNNAERDILQHLIHEIFAWLCYSPCSMFPIDSPSWKDTYSGVAGDFDLKAKTEDVLRIATANFQNMKFRLVYPEDVKDETSKVSGPYKVYLAYTKIGWPEDQE